MMRVQCSRCKGEGVIVLSRPLQAVIDAARDVVAENPDNPPYFTTSHIANHRLLVKVKRTALLNRLRALVDIGLVIDTGKRWKRSRIWRLVAQDQDAQHENRRLPWA